MPVISTWMLRPGHVEPAFFENVRSSYDDRLERLLRVRWIAASGVLRRRRGRSDCCCCCPASERRSSRAIDSRQLQLRLRAPTGTRLERTELIALKAMDVIKRQVGPDNVEITTGFIGVQPPNYPINTIYLFTSGQHEAVLGVALKPSAPAVTDDVKEALRRALKQALPDVAVSFEAGDIVSQVMSFGSPTPIEVAVQGPSLAVEPAVRRKGVRGAGTGRFAARPAVCAAARLSVAANPDRSQSRRAVWRDGCGRRRARWWRPRRPAASPT